MFFAGTRNAPGVLLSVIVHTGIALPGTALLGTVTLSYSASKKQRRSMQQPRFELAVVMQKRPIDNRWQSEVWQPVAVMTDTVRDTTVTDNHPEQITAADGVERWVFHGLYVTLQRDEAEGYYLNISTHQPRVFVLWRIDDDRGVPQRVTASYDEACTWMDAGEQVDSVAMPPDMYDVVSAFARQHYRPEPKKRIRPRSFQSRAQGPRSRH